MLMWSVSETRLDAALPVGREEIWTFTCTDEPVADAKSARLLSTSGYCPWLSNPATAGPMVRVRDYLALLEVATTDTTGSDDEHVDA
jgi:hypothetical protein